MLKIEEHEKSINDLSQFLNVEGIDQAKISTILQGLRDNYNEVNTSMTESTTKIASINELNEGLRSANMGLLSKLGTQMSNINKPEKHEKPDEEKPETVKSLEDIANEFLK